MKFYNPILIVALICLSLVANPALANNLPLPFDRFIQSVKKEALHKGISPKTVTTYLNDLKEPEKKSIHYAEHQQQHRITFQKYKLQFVNSDFLARSNQALQENKQLLQKITQQFEVSPRYIIALWGIESYFGQNVGKASLIQSLASLAYANKRHQFFRDQLIAALQMLDKPIVIPQQLLSSPDGGMGQPQFMPITYQDSAYDFNKDGFINIWTSVPDVFASIANFLHQLGWKLHQDCRTTVTLAKNFPLSKTSIGIKSPVIKKSIRQWLKMGVKPNAGYQFTQPLTDKAAIVLPDGPTGQAYMVFKNFFVLQTWNKNVFEGLSACELADKMQDSN